MSEASVTTGIKLGGYGITKAGGTGLIFIAVILTESEDARNFNTSTHNNYERIQFVDVIDSDNDID